MKTTGSRRMGRLTRKTSIDWTKPPIIKAGHTKVLEIDIHTFLISIPHELACSLKLQEMTLSCLHVLMTIMTYQANENCEPQAS